MLTASEFILNPDVSVYHLGLKPEDIADTIITVGDPDRVEKITSFFEEIYFTRHVREFKSIKGRYKGKDILVISTGIGTDNIDIVFTELDACANIDFATRTIKKDHRQLTFFRLGTSGTLREDIPVGSYLASEFAIGMDCLMNFYEYTKSEIEIMLEQSLKSHFEQEGLDFQFYIAEADASLVNTFYDKGFLKGVTITAPGFYGPQGRHIRIPSKKKDFLSYMSSLNLMGNKITNLEMETAGIYGMANALGHKAVSLNAIIANRFTWEFAKDPAAVVDGLIDIALSEITSL